MSTSIKDVARLAGVSVATVSHVINETRFVSDPTRDKVLEAIEQLQYSPNILARKFKTGLRDTVGFVVPDIANGYFATLIEEVEDVLRTRGFRLIVSNTREQVDRELDSLRMLSSGVVDGLVIASTVDEFAAIDAVLPNDFPVVFIDRAVGGAPTDIITTDNSGAIREGVAALIAHGHSRIGFLASVRHLSTTAERVSAYRETLTEHGIEPEERLIRYLESMTDPVQAPADALIAEGCTAIVASNNVLTSKLFAASQGADWAGGDVEILGYRDPAHGEFTGSNAQWLEEPIGEMGRLAAEAILRRISDPAAEARRTVLQASYTARGRAGVQG